MKVLGIDPGLTATGYGIVERIGNRITPLGWGVIRSGEGSLAERLDCIFSRVTEIISKYHPELVAVEDIFTGRNPRSGLKLGHARGVLILAAARGGYAVREYPAATVKQASSKSATWLANCLGWRVRRSRKMLLMRSRWRSAVSCAKNPCSWDSICLSNYAK